MRLQREWARRLGAIEETVAMRMEAIELIRKAPPTAEGGEQTGPGE